MSPDGSSSSQRRRGGLALAGVMAGYVVLCILAGLGVGFVLDHLLRTAPLFLISGTVIGFIVSFYLIYRVAMGELGD